MVWLSRLVRRCRLLLRRDAAERSMDAELRDHIDFEIADRVRGGMDAHEARRTTLRDFGSIEAIKEEARDARGGRLVEDLLLDVRYAVRVLARERGFTAAAVITFGLGVGAVTAISSVVYGILLRPLPYADADRLVAVWERDLARDGEPNVVSLDNFEAWRARTRSLAGMSAIMPTSATLVGDGLPERLVGADVTPAYFGLLGVRPAIGRDFLPEDANTGAAVILSDALWRRRFAADPAIVGRAVTMSGKPFTIVGVMPASFDPPRFGWLGEQSLWFPLVATEQSRAWGRFLLVVARLRDGASLPQASADMVAIARQRAREVQANEGWSATVVPLATQITGEIQTALLVLLGAVGLLLLMAVANVATLTLSTIGRRGHELAIRRAIGATGPRLFRQLFTQSAILGLIGALVGVAAAVPGVPVLVALLPADVPRASSIAVDVPVLMVTTAAASIATIFFGALAAVRGRRAAGTSPLTSHPQDGLRTRTGAGGGALVTAEIAMAVALGVMALLMVRSFAGLRAVDLGFRPQNVVIARIALPDDGYRTPQSQRLFFDELGERLRPLADVRASGVISTRPFGGLASATTIRDALQKSAPGVPDVVADVRYADAGLFRALGIPLVHGSLFEARDAAGQPPRALISAGLARTLWRDVDATGQRLAIDLDGGIVATVAGVVGDIHLMDARTPPRPVVYLSASQFPGSVRDLVVRVDSRPEEFLRTLRATVGTMDASLPLYAVTTMTQLVDRSVAGDRLTTTLLAGFAIVALLLAGVGVLGVFAGDVTRRRKEIGIRLALGASKSSLARMFLGAALRRAALGVAAGALTAALLGRAMQSLLFGVGSTDPISFVTVAATVTGLALTATLVPTWRAISVDPLRSLRED